MLNECTGGVASKPGKPSPGLFKSNMIHLGGDEVDTSCWSSTPAVAAWLKAQGMTPDQGYAYFVKRVAAMASAQGHRPIQWSEVCTGLDSAWGATISTMYRRSFARCCDGAVTVL